MLSPLWGVKSTLIHKQQNEWFYPLVSKWKTDCFPQCLFSWVNLNTHNIKRQEQAQWKVETKQHNQYIMAHKTGNQPVSWVDSSICLNPSFNCDTCLTRYISIQSTYNTYRQCMVKTKWISYSKTSLSNFNLSWISNWYRLKQFSGCIHLTQCFSFKSHNAHQNQKEEHTKSRF